MSKAEMFRKAHSSVRDGRGETVEECAKARTEQGPAQSSLHARVFKDKTYVQYFPLGNFAHGVGYCSHETKCSSSSMSSHPMMPMITCQDVSVWCGHLL